MMAAVMMILLTAWLQQLFWQFGISSTITLERCRLPDYPEFGDFGPKMPFYYPGDVINYFCDTNAYMGGNYRRVCMDSGDWSGDTPVCDRAAVITQHKQSSTAQPESTHDASRATDGDRETCSKTIGEGKGAEWTGTLQDFPREVLRFMLFLPKGHGPYEVFIVRHDGSELSCGRNRNIIGLHDWVFHNCIPPNHTEAVAVKVKSLTERPLEICEVMVHTLTDPTCVDPHFQVTNGRLRLTRKTATLVCDDGYTRYDRSPKKLDCIGTGVWSRRNLRCEAIQFEVVDVQDVPQNEGSPQKKEPETSGNERNNMEEERTPDTTAGSTSKQFEVVDVRDVPQNEESTQKKEPESSGKDITKERTLISRKEHINLQEEST